MNDLDLDFQGHKRTHYLMFVHTLTFGCIDLVLQLVYTPIMYHDMLKNTVESERPRLDLQGHLVLSLISAALG